MSTLEIGGEASLQTDHELREAIQSLEAQLRSLYEDREKASGDSETIQSLVEQLGTFYAEREANGGQTYMDLIAKVESLQAELADFYARSNEEAASADSSGPSAAADEASSGGESAPAASAASAMVSSLEAQVRALIDERDDYVRLAGKLRQELIANQTKVKSILAGIQKQRGQR